MCQYDLHRRTPPQSGRHQVGPNFLGILWESGERCVFEYSMLPLGSWDSLSADGWLLYPPPQSPSVTRWSSISRFSMLPCLGPRNEALDRPLKSRRPSGGRGGLLVRAACHAKW